MQVISPISSIVLQSWSFDSDLAKGRLPYDPNDSSENEKATGIWGFFFNAAGGADETEAPKVDKDGRVIRSDKDFGLVRGDSISEKSTDIQFESRQFVYGIFIFLPCRLKKY